jgi:hypothetical protein
VIWIGAIIATEIVQTYASGLVMLNKNVQTFEDLPTTALKSWFLDVRDHTHSFLLPFLGYPESPKKRDWERGSVLLNNIFPIAILVF